MRPSASAGRPGEESEGAAPRGAGRGGDRATPEEPRRLLVGALLVLVAARLAFHAAYVPAYEGPDEPFHLARIASLVDGPRAAAWSGREVDPVIVGSVRASPCGPSLERAFGCPAFGGAGGAELNVLRRGEPPPVAAARPNYEAHQPPLYYAAAALPVSLARAVAPAAARDPVLELLLARLFSVGLVLLALAGPIRSAARSDPRGDWLPAFAALLLLPGASESLARCANDAGVFAWTAVVVSCVLRSRRTLVVAALLVAGPLIKLTALPVVAFAVAWLALDRGWRHGAGAAAAALAFVPLQWARGYLWGGTVEMNAAGGALHESAARSAVGLVRSTYTLLKTFVWLGEWSFFRAPAWLLGGVAVFLLALALAVRRTPAHRRQIPHVAGVLTAAASVLAFFVSHRIHWDQWGGVGGWYLWGWTPWLAVASAAFFRIPGPGARRRLAWGLAALVLLANVAWFLAAHATYAGQARA